MRKFALLALPVIISAAQSVLSLPAVAAHLSSGDRDWQLWIALVLIGGFVVNHYITVGTPYSRFMRFEAARLNILDQHVDPVERHYRAKEHCEIRVNVMLASRRIISFLEPWKAFPALRKPVFFKTHLSPVWVSTGMNHHHDSDLRFTASQGVCGRAFSDKEKFLADLTVTPSADFNLNSRQMDKAAGLKFVLSFPIRKLDPKTLRITSGVLGVVNIDSRADGAERLVNDPEALNELSRKAQDISELCSQLF